MCTHETFTTTIADTTKPTIKVIVVRCGVCNEIIGIDTFFSDVQRHLRQLQQDVSDIKGKILMK